MTRYSVLGGLYLFMQPLLAVTGAQEFVLRLVGFLCVGVVT
jgi:hypothetical protein